MSGYRSSFFRHNCRDRGVCYVEQLPNWDDIIDCFPRSIRPTDIDGMVEINGNLLFLEEKRCGAPLEDGQRRALRILANVPTITVLYFRPLLSGRVEMLVFDGAPPVGWQEVSRGEFHAWLTGWAAAADRAVAA